MNRTMKIIASFFYLGCFPIASGTAGTAGAAAIYAALIAGGLRGATLTAVVAALMVVSSLLCIPAGNWAERTYKKKDPGIVVMDEVAGFFLTVMLIPVATAQDGWVVCIAGFFLFRLFDIVKPPPVRRLERLGGGLGILLDDLMAGVYSYLALLVGLKLFY